MNLIPRDPFTDFERLFAPWMQTEAKELEARFFSPKVDIKDKDDHYEITAELAGVKKSDIQIELDRGTLTLTAISEQESEDEQAQYIRRERRTGKYMRSFQLGDAVSEEDIQAQFEDGLLRLVIAKKQARQATNRRIDIL